MSLLSRKKAVQIGIETVAKGTLASSLEDALAFDFEIASEAEYQERKGTAGYLGYTSPGVLADNIGTATMTLELRGDGSTGLDAALAAALQSSGFKLTTGTYAPASAVADQKTVSIVSFEDGIKKTLTGAMADVTFEYEAGKIIRIKFDFKGIYNAVVDAAIPGSYAPSSVIPMQFSRNSTCTLGGSDRMLSKITLQMNNQLAYRDTHYVITDRGPEISIDPEACTVASFDYHGLLAAGTTSAFSNAISDGTQTATLAAPKIQFNEIKSGDRDGLAINDITGKCLINAGNDEVTLTVS